MRAATSKFFREAGLGSIVLALAAALPASALAQQPAADAAAVKASTPGRVSAAATASVSARIEAIDAATRTLTLKGPRGKLSTLVAGPEVKNFEQVKVGDFVVVRYVEALTLELKKGGAGVRERSESQATDKAKPGERPGVAGGQQINVVADVVAVNRKKQTVTLRGPQRTMDLKVKDPAQLKLIKVGDQVDATYTEAVAVSVEPASKSSGGKN